MEKNELNYIIAKYLVKQFPEIGEAYIKECEKRKVFPKSITGAERSFKDLDETTTESISNDQLIKLIELGLPESKNKSLLFNTKLFEKGDDIDSFINRGRPLLTTEEKWSHDMNWVGHFDEVTTMIIDATGKLLITGSKDTFIKIWSLPECILTTTFSGHKGDVIDIILNSTNTLLFSCAADKTICLYSLIDGSFKGRIISKCSIEKISLSPSDKYLAAACDDGICRLYNVNVEIPQIEREPFMILSFPGSQKIVSLDFLNDDIIGYASETGDIIIASITTKSSISTYYGDDSGNEIRFLKNSNLLVRSFKEKIISVFKASNGNKYDTEIQMQFRDGQKKKIQTFDMSCDEFILAGITHDEFILWNSSDGTEASIGSELVPGDKYTCISFSTTSPELLFVGTQMGFCYTWNLRRMSVVSKFVFPSGQKITKAVWSPNGKKLAAGGSLGELVVFQLPFGCRCIKEQFMSKELNLNSNETKIYDRSKNEVFPQPNIKKLQDFELTVTKQTKRNKTLNTKEWEPMIPQQNSYLCNTTKRVPPVTDPISLLPMPVSMSPIKPSKSSSLILNEFSQSSRISSSTSIDLARSNSPIPVNSSLQASPHHSEYDFVDDSSDVQPEPTTLPDWTFWPKQEQHTYIPQIGEEVVYFKQGHRSLYKLFNVEYIKTPYEHKPQMPKVAYAKITSIVFAVTHLVITLDFHNIRNFSCDVVYPLPDILPFLIPTHRYKASLQFAATLHEGSIVHIPYIEDTGVVVYEAIIENIKPDFMEYGFECLTVGFTDGGDMSKISPWEVQFNEKEDKVKPAPNEPDINEVQEAFVPYVAECFDKYKIYDEIRDSGHKDILFYAQKLPMDLKLFLDRVSNKWYNTIDEMIKDILLFKSNAPLVGIPDDIGSELSSRLASQLNQLAMKNVLQRRIAR